jgi:pantoate--beta-alanine ligase
MTVLSTVKELQTRLCKLQLSPVGLVPTMGALHQGHLSLVEKAVMKCPQVVVSIYVNPAQFNDISDLKNYPRTPENDLELLQNVLRNNDIVFTPDNKEIYPLEDNREFHFGNLDMIMEGLHRPGHFNGVARVVSRLFEIVKPDIAIFGMKDFQQLVIIKELVKQTGNKVIIEAAPIIRESDGLAMSSRNQLLGPEIRKNAPVIYRTISAASGMLAEYDIPDIISFVHNTINNVRGFRVEYFEIVDDEYLIPVSKRDEMIRGTIYRGCIAVKAGNIRLLDNMDFGLV